ncbi:hypothetical protein ACIBCM_22460 [Streptomyces sp. NPDC051018]|uniref:hypothetical protein n=1 Tax=Streptomyces sp. NPDC051018 TaxID=3365639 RepID=UPI0037A38872
MNEARRAAADTPATSTARPDPTPITSLRSAIEEALQARDTLVSALRRGGVVSLAVEVRTPWPDAGPDTLVHIGPCSARTAQLLAAIIAKGAAR